MLEIPVDHGEFAVLAQQRQQLGAHGHQPGGAARGAVETAEQFLPARLGGLVQGHGGGIVGVVAIGRQGRGDARMVGPEAACQMLEEGQALVAFEVLPAIEKDAGQRRARGLPAPAEDGFGQPRQILGSGAGTGLALQHAPPALGDGLQQVLKGARRHRPAPISAFGSQVAMAGKDAQDDDRQHHAQHVGQRADEDGLEQVCPARCR